ncbi:MAG: Lipoprotein-releasing system ATP-binding protein LolD [Chlamydiae bacterium]|nr:Lipoprotein-releasing system ATP-binding protein LolD [Chlamydiota bacterium]
MIMEPILQAKKICKCFTRPTRVDVLKDVSLELYPGQSVAIMGASGEGKSTLLHILGTLEAPDSGDLLIAGISAAHNPTPLLRNRHIGFIFQGYNLLENYTTIQNILMPALISGKPIHKGTPAYQRALELLGKVDLEDRAEFSTKLLSGGEKQRVAIARALCNDPGIILADEPSGNLDHQTSKMIHDLLLHCCKDLSKALIVVTHDRELASLCDKTVQLCNGEIKCINPS